MCRENWYIENPLVLRNYLVLVWKKDYDSFLARRTYNTTWVLHSRRTKKTTVMSPMFWCSTQAQNSLRDKMVDMLRFTKPAPLVNELRRLNCRIKWRNNDTPQYPFQTICLDDIEIQKPALLSDIPDNTESLVDSEPSGERCWECINPQGNGSILCQQHIEQAHQLL